MNLDELHNKLIDMGFKIKAAPDEATIYQDVEGTTVTVDEPDQREIKKVLSTTNIHPVTGNCTPKETAIILQQILIKRDAE